MEILARMIWHQMVADDTEKRHRGEREGANESMHNGEGKHEGGKEDNNGKSKGD